MARFEKTTTSNLYRRGDKYYLVATVAGRKIQRSLETSRLDVARLKLPLKLAETRARLVGAVAMKNAGLETIGEAVAVWESEKIAQGNLKPSTLSYYREMRAIIEATTPTNSTPQKINLATLRAWWIIVSEKYSPQRANNVLAALVACLELQKKAGVRNDNPAKNLRRVKIKNHALKLPSIEKFKAIVQSIRNNKSPAANESANMVAFLAFSGLRIGELQFVRWSHISENMLTITGGSAGTKNGRVRHIPIIKPLQDILPKIEKNDGPYLFKIKRPRKALISACKENNVEPLRLHDLRHLFATVCIESGVDIPTVSNWLGHQDGGALAMRTYGHLRNEHSLNMAKRVSFE